MSTKYKFGDEVPLDVLIKRLKELSYQITKGNLSGFHMRKWISHENSRRS